MQNFSFLRYILILAGGFGKRLRGIVKDVPKPMVDINGRPFLSYLMDYLSRQDVSKILLSVGYRYEVIKNYFGLRYKNLNIEYVIENKPLGTGGAIRESLKRVKDRNIIILNGDTLFNIDLKKMADFHFAHNSTITIAVKPMYNFDRYGTVSLEKDRIVGFEEKTFKDFGYINGGVYIVNKRIFESFKQSRTPFSFEVGFLYKNINNIPSFAFICKDYFIDIGVPEDYERAQGELNQVVKGIAK